MSEGRLGTSGHPYQKSGMGKEEEGVALWLPFVVGRSGERVVASVVSLLA